MAHGSEKKYALNLDDIIAFPDAGHMPVLPAEPGESWIVLLEVSFPAEKEAVRKRWKA